MGSVSHGFAALASGRLVGDDLRRTDHDLRGPCTAEVSDALWILDAAALQFVRELFDDAHMDDRDAQADLLDRLNAWRAAARRRVLDITAELELQSEICLPPD